MPTVYVQEFIIASSLVFFFAGFLSYLFFSNFKDQINRSFAYVFLSIGIWGLFRTLFYLFILSPNYIVNLFISFSMIVIPFIGATLIEFGLLYHTVHVKRIYSLGMIRSVNYYVAITLSLLMILDTFFDTSFIIADITPVPGPLMPLLVAQFIFAVFMSTSLIFSGRNNSDNAIQKQSLILSSSLFIGLLSSSLLFAGWYQIFLPPTIPIIGSLILFLGVLYGTFAYHIFNLRVLVSELLIFTIWVALFVRMLFDDTVEEVLIDVGLLLAVVLLGSYITRAIKGYDTSREKLTELTDKLQSLNTGLERKVEQRTKTLDRLLLHTDTLIEEIPIGIIEYNREFQLIRINEEAERILGADRSTVLNEVIEPNKLPKEGFRSLVEITYPFLSDSAKKIPSDEVDDVTDTHEMQLIEPRKRDVQVITLPYVSPDGEEEEGIIKMIRDVTKERAIDRSKSEFISVAAHKLRTPLSGIKWALRFVLDEDAGPISDKQREFLNKSFQTNEDMIKLVNDLLDVARIEKGKLEYDMRTNSLTEVVTDVIRRSTDAAKHGQINLQVHMPQEAIPPFVFDKGKIMLVLDHLITNGIKYTPAKGTVTVTMHSLDEKKQVVIDVEDTGIGISEEQRDQLFTKFFRSDEAMHMHTEGSGLGLLISKEIVTKHNGIISVEPREGGGTIARVILPLDNEIKAN